MVPADVYRRIYAACDVPIRRALYVTCRTIYDALFTSPSISLDAMWLVFDRCDAATMQRVLIASRAMCTYVSSQLGGKISVYVDETNKEIYGGCLTVSTGNLEVDFDLDAGVEITSYADDILLSVSSDCRSYRTRLTLPKRLYNYTQRMIV